MHKNINEICISVKLLLFCIKTKIDFIWKYNGSVNKHYYLVKSCQVTRCRATLGTA